MITLQESERLLDSNSHRREAKRHLSGDPSHAESAKEKAERLQSIEFPAICTSAGILFFCLGTGWFAFGDKNNYYLVIFFALTSAVLFIMAGSYVVMQRRRRKREETIPMNERTYETFQNSAFE